MTSRLFTASERGLATLRTKAFRHVHDLPMLTQNTERRGALVSRVTSDVDQVSQFLVFGGLLLIVSVGQVVIATVVMLIYSWQLALVVGEQRGGDFVRPLYWHIPKPKAPDALNRLHFGFLNIHNLEIASSPAAQHAPKHSLELEQQIVVLPLTTKPSDATQAFGLSTRFSG